MNNPEGLRAVSLGENGPDVSVIGYGTYHLLDKLDAYTAIESMGRAYEAGITLFDTSDNYGTELAIGKAVAEGVLPRENIFITTKTGLATSATEALEWDRNKSTNTSPRRIHKQVEKSLWLLGDAVGHIDLYQLHAYDPEANPFEIAYTMQDLIYEGKVGAYGVSNYPAEAITKLLEVCDYYGYPKPVSSQSFYNVLTSFDNQEAIDTAHSSGLTVLAHSPLHKGALTSLAIDIVESGIIEAEQHEERDKEVVQTLQAGVKDLKQLQEYAQSKGQSLATLSLAWLAMQGNTVVLSACTEPEYLENAVEAANWQIDDEGLNLISEVRSKENTRDFAGLMFKVMQRTKLYYR
jgi:aryl-alcohol dehydrogenase-like predicted oxidoreductase